MKNRIGAIVRKKIRIDGVLHYEEWKLVKRYTFKTAHSRDLRKKHTGSDKLGAAI